jgi:4-amino-4-deoxy-L-arabinose transferase-like glycosyltransferase
MPSALAAILPEKHQQRQWLLLIVAAALVARVVAVLVTHDAHPGWALYADSDSYLGAARSLVEDGTLNLRPGSSQPILFRTPGYPVFIAGVFEVFGDRLLPVLLLQALLSVGTVFLAYVIAARVWDDSVGLVAAGILAFDPFQIRAADWIANESLTSLLLLGTAGLGYLMFGDAKRRVWAAAGLGVCLGVATLVRPSTYYFPFLVAVVVVVIALIRRAPRALAATGVFVLAFACLVVPWQIRNQVRTDTWRMSGVEGANMYYFRGAGTIAERDGLSLLAGRARLHRDYPDLPATMTFDQWEPPDGSKSGPWFARMNSAGIEVMRENPVAAAKMSLRSLVQEVTNFGAWESRSSMEVDRYFGVRGAIPGFRSFLIVALLISYVLMAYGAVIAWRDRRFRAGHAFALGLAVYVLLVSAGPEARYNSDRFRVAVFPILALFLAFGVVTVVRRLRARRARMLGEVPPG